MTQRKPTRRTIRSGTRVMDGRGTGTALGSTGLPPLCDPREWIWIDWDGDRGMKVARIADIAATETRRGDPPMNNPCALTPAEIASSDERIAAYRAAGAALTGEDWERLETMLAEMRDGTREPDAAERRRRILETTP